MIIYTFLLISLIEIKFEILLKIQKMDYIYFCTLENKNNGLCILFMKLHKL